MTTKAGLTPAGRSRMRALYYALWKTSSGMNADSPIDVLKNFAGLMRGSGPFLSTTMSIVTPWVLLITAITEHDWVRRTFTTAKDSVTSQIFCSVAIEEEHDMHGQLLNWMVKQGLGQGVRTLALAPPWWGRDYYDFYLLDHGKQPELKYMPDVGTYTCVFGGRTLTIRRSIERREHSRDDIERITISCISPFAGAQTIKAFLDHIQAFVEASQQNKTSIFRPNNKGWRWDHGEHSDGYQCWTETSANSYTPRYVGITRPSRTLKAVTLDPAIKDPLVKDIEAYLNPQTRKYYSNRGIPWRRGFMFYGPPGTGKTSFTTALAGHFKLNVYVLSLSSTTLNDQRLEGLFGALPMRCIVLLEDVDSAGIKREDMNAGKGPAKKSGKAPSEYDVDGNPGDDQPSGITLSGLLNVLDGVHSIEGRYDFDDWNAWCETYADPSIHSIVIMTTNVYVHRRL